MVTVAWLVVSPVVLILRTPVGNVISEVMVLLVPAVKSAKSITESNWISLMPESTSEVPTMAISAGSIWMRLSEKPSGWCSVEATRLTVFMGMTGTVTSTLSTLRVR